MTGKRMNVENDFRKSLLRWYDQHRRVLPWRALHGEIPNPYHVWLSEVMLQQTTVPAVVPYFLKFLEKWPSVHNLAEADNDDVMQNWAGLGYYARARNLHKCAKYVSRELDGVFPDTLDGLKKLPGVGDYTSAAIRSIAFNKPANVVDGNVERVMARIFAVRDPLPISKPILKQFAAQMAEGESARCGDYAQALMDLGATICTPAPPKCGLCPVANFCKAREEGVAASLPARTAKAQKPFRHGYVYWVTNKNGDVLFERRAEKGLLGGMTGLPTSEWVERGASPKHLSFFQKHKDTKVVVRHTFTHFDLELHGFAVIMGNNTPKDDRYFWVNHDKIIKTGIPSVFKKAVKQFL